MTQEKTDRLAKIMNRSLSQDAIDKINAMAGEPVGETDKEAVPVGPVRTPVTGAVPVDDTEYIASIVIKFFMHFEKYGPPSVAATLTLAACHLKASAAVALIIKDFKKVVEFPMQTYPAIPVKADSFVIPGKKRGRPKKVK